MSSEGAQIYIPNSCLYKRGLMIGYNISGFCIHVIDVQDKISAVEIERTLRDPSLDKFNSLCHANLIVLGIALNAGEPLPESCIERMENNNIWVNMEIQKSNDSYPFSLKDLYVCGYKYKVRCEIVAYDDRSDRRLMTLNRAALAEDLFESNRLETFIQSSPAIQNDRTNLDQTLREYFEKSDNIYDKNYDLNTVELLRAKTIQEDPNFNREVPNLTYIIKQINLCHVIRKAYHIALKQNAGKPVENAVVQEEEKAEKTEKTEEIVEEKKVESAVWNSEEYKEMEKTTLYRQSLAILNPWRFITVIFIFFFQFQRIGFLLFGNFISFKIPIVNKSLRDYGLFTHVYDEIVFKLKIMEKWPLWLSILNNKSQSSNYIFLFQVYNKLYSGLTFMIADTLIGLLFTYAMYSHAQNILHIIHMLFQGFHIKDLVEKVGWLLDEPSGFKANRDFNRAIGAVVTFLLNIWEYYTTFITPYEGVLLKVFSFYGLGGMSFVLVIGKEVIRIYTLHIWFLYNALTKVYNYWLESFKNFFAILRDKRINNITKKKEDFEFEWPQKLIATTIAITLISLLPTLLMYYVWSLWMQIAVLIMNVILTKVVDFINEFPLFLLISYFVDPESVFPCGLAFQLPKKIKSSDSGNRPSKQNGDGLSDYLELHPQKMPINFIISPFVKKITKLSAQFKLNNLVSFIFKGISIFSTISYNDRSKRDDRRVLKMNFNSIKDDIKTFLSL